MALTTGMAILGASVIGGVASASAASKASKAAKNAATQNNALLQAAQDRAYQTIDPYLKPGYDATNSLARIVGGSGYAAQGQGQNAMAAAGGVDWNAYLQQNPDAAAWVQSKAGSPDVAGKTPVQLAELHYQMDGSRRELPTTAPTPSPEPTTAPGENPTYGPQIAPRPVTSRPTYAPLDISQGSYVQSPDYEFQLSEGNRNILAQKSRLGGLESGAALKDLQKYGQDLALGDYSQWRGYTTQQYNTDRDFTNTNYDIDTSRSDARYDADRGYLTSRFDTQVNDLFRLSGQGLSAAGTAINVGQNTATNMGANNNSAASASANAAIAGSNNVNSMLGTALQAYGAFKSPGSGGTYGGYGAGGYGTPPIAPGSYTAPTSPSYSGQYVRL